MYNFKQLIYHFFAEIEVLRSKPGSYLFWRRRELSSFGVHYEKNIWVGKNLSIYGFGNIYIGERCALGDNTQLINHAKIIIGNDFLSANNLIINSGTHDPITLIPRGVPIKIGDNVWCGTRVTIISGVKIGNNVVIGSGSVVVSDIPPNCVAVGIPAKPIKDLYRNNIKKLWSWL